MLVSSLVNFTDAFTSTAPLGSDTIPVSVARSPWAKSRQQEAIRKTTTEHRACMDFPPIELRSLQPCQVRLCLGLLERASARTSAPMQSTRCRSRPTLVFRQVYD